jgi:hypothetical protein
MKLFYTGPQINTEMLVSMLDKHGIAAEERSLGGDPDDLNRLAEVWVPVPDYDRAYNLFYTTREDEL